MLKKSRHLLQSLDGTSHPSRWVGQMCFCQTLYGKSSRIVFVPLRRKNEQKPRHSGMTIVRLAGLTETRGICAAYQKAARDQDCYPNLPELIIWMIKVVILVAKTSI